MDYITRVEYEEYTKRMNDEHKRQNHRISEIENNFRQLHALTLSIEKLAFNVENMENSIHRQWERIEKLEETPKSNWNKLKDGILGAIASAIGVAIVMAIVKFM